MRQGMRQTGAGSKVKQDMRQGMRQTGAGSKVKQEEERGGGEGGGEVINPPPCSLADKPGKQTSGINISRARTSPLL